ncbi:glycoside hydrolase family 16 protein [Cutibacterium equinum]|uniref:Glycoside hydrolase family 16 protein n=1 Tax=Cutibacterium equinum TaxID=3016342 RepID=A0ABY7QYR6_9ACTN|nr:glycoside hydrolase family 16 protein [Cutibacterium equinum]WCC79699.1 glycoside hydrolase family 16 protein [Cutibacterium equinum]
MALMTRRSVLGAAILTASASVVVGHGRAVAADADIDLTGWTLLNIGDEFTDPVRSSSQWHRGLWYPHSGKGLFRDANVSFSDGQLRLAARAEQIDTFSYTFSAVESVFDVPGLCTYVEVRAKALPSAANVLSAIWMQSSALDGGPSLLAGAEPNPELDIEETFDHTKMNIATHVWPDNTETTHRSFGGYSYPVGVDISRDFHTYGVERRDGRLRFYFDRHLAWETNPGDSSLWRMSRHMVLSLEGHLGTPVASQLPATFDIDYVRTWYAPNPALESGDYLLTSADGRFLVSHDGAPTLQAQPQTWRVVRHDDCTYSLSTPDGAVLGVDTEAGKHEVVVGSGRLTTSDAGGSLNRWHLLAGRSGRTLHSKFTGLPIIVADSRVIEGVDGDPAAVWMLTETGSSPVRSSSAPAPSTPDRSVPTVSNGASSRRDLPWTRLTRSGV